MACDQCGARRGHLDGCPLKGGGGGGGGSRKAGKPKNTPGHKHNYQPTGSYDTPYRDGRKKMILTTYKFECLTPGCPRPHHEEYSRRMALWPVTHVVRGAGILVDARKEAEEVSVPFPPRKVLHLGYTRIQGGITVCETRGTGGRALRIEARAIVALVDMSGNAVLPGTGNLLLRRQIHVRP